MIGHLLNATLDVYRGTFAADGRGGRVKTMEQAGTIRAMVSQPSDQERQIAAQFGARLDAIVYTAEDADVQRDDELDGGDSRRWRVIDRVTNSRDTYLRLHCTEVQGG